ncbi:pyridoxine [Microthyrium microscopicum]|uniref:glutaminase n=1 Tax=Microthyrium microscopicum TaxID=703497 RepID=A0A6A6UM20_9PEZI|nr:pyridoxine [Microthyrium microscopicum]
MTQVEQLTVGVLALQGAFSEHIQLLRKAAVTLNAGGATAQWKFTEVRTAEELASCDALIVPGGESTAISLVAARNGLLDNLRDFVKVKRKPTWGTCAGLILLAESANRTKKGGQELIGGLDVRVNRNHFGRQTESFTTNIELPFLSSLPEGNIPYHAIFIRAPVVEKILPHVEGIQTKEAERDDTVVAPSLQPEEQVPRDLINTEVEVMASLIRTEKHPGTVQPNETSSGGDIIAVRQGNCFGTSFHPELTDDPRIHVWWLQEILQTLHK